MKKHLQKWKKPAITTSLLGDKKSAIKGKKKSGLFEFKRIITDNHL